ncbi:MAG: hypothetical protein Q8P35_00840 [Candidatus Yanofskybacteria bacterium]|nr:hypothetical protein [Candidatus Yanofskybacteria bacterium]
MAKARSRNWDENQGMCIKHFIPQVPCPQCIAEQDPDVQVVITVIDLDVAKVENLGVAELVFGDFAWCRNLVQG